MPRRRPVLKTSLGVIFNLVAICSTLSLARASSMSSRSLFMAIDVEPLSHHGGDQYPATVPASELELIISQFVCLAPVSSVLPSCATQFWKKFCASRPVPLVLPAAGFPGSRRGNAESVSFLHFLAISAVTAFADSGAADPTAMLI